MGARISIDLQSLLLDPRIKVAFESEVCDEGESTEYTEHRAIVTFAGSDKKHYFDYHSHDGKVFLEADFNFFRDEERHKILMRALYEHGVVFTVIPG